MMQQNMPEHTGTQVPVHSPTATSGEGKERNSHAIANPSGTPSPLCALHFRAHSAALTRQTIGQMKTSRLSRISPLLKVVFIFFLLAQRPIMFRVIVVFVNKFLQRWEWPNAGVTRCCEYEFTIGTENSRTNSITM